MNNKSAFIGLGNMGYPMAGHLQKAGHSVCVFNRSADKAKSWEQEFGGSTASTPSAAAQDAEFIFTCVGNDDDVREVILGDDGVLAGTKAGAIIIDNTTTSASLARELAEKCADKGVGFLDAPVSGGQAGAENGILTVMVGGEQKTFDEACQAINSYASKVQLMGPAGYGQLTKMVNQICIAGLVQALSEAIHFAKRAGLDVEQVMGVISKGAAQSWQMENRYKTMSENEFEFGFAVNWMRKDLGFAMDEAQRNDANLPVTGIVDGYYQQIQKMGGGRWDTSSLIALLEK